MKQVGVLLGLSPGSGAGKELMAEELDVKHVTLNETLGYRNADPVFNVRDETGAVRRPRVPAGSCQAYTFGHHLRHVRRRAWSHPQGRDDR